MWNSPERFRSQPGFKIARNPRDVTDAWRLVYQAYRRIGLIGPNPERVYCTDEALRDGVTVILNRCRRRVATTMTVYPDHRDRLPLDQAYPSELDRLRRQDRRLMEIGLFADHRETPERVFNAVFECVRWSTYYGIHHGATDAIIGVNPRHVPFYRRSMGFESIGPVKGYASVNHRPVELLRLNWQSVSRCRTRRKLRGIRHVLDNPLPVAAFARGLPLGALREHADSPFRQFLRSHPASDLLRQRAI